MDRVDGILGTGIVGTCVSRRKLAPTERGGARYMRIDGRVVPGKLLPSVEDVVAMCDDAVICPTDWAIPLTGTESSRKSMTTLARGHQTISQIPKLKMLTKNSSHGELMYLLHPLSQIMIAVTTIVTTATHACTVSKSVNTELTMMSSSTTKKPRKPPASPTPEPFKNCITPPLETYSFYKFVVCYFKTLHEKKSLRQGHTHEPTRNKR